MTIQELKDLRKFHGITQVEIRNIAGIDQSYLSRLEHGHHKLVPKMELRMLRAFDLVLRKRKEVLALSSFVRDEHTDYSFVELASR